MCTHVTTPFLVVLGIFWPQGPNFKLLKFLVLQAMYVKKLHLTVKIGPVWKVQIFYSSQPPKPKIGPGMLKRALIILVQSNNDH